MVEIYAGDLYFDQSVQVLEEQAQKEQEAAQKLFGTLPTDQQAKFELLWQEFEEQITPEAKFAKALDALQPILQTWGSGGKGAKDQSDLTYERLLDLKQEALAEFPQLWALAKQILDQAVKDGILHTD